MQRAVEMSALLVGALLWHLPNLMLMLRFLGCLSSAGRAVFWPLDPSLLSSPCETSQAAGRGKAFRQICRLLRKNPGWPGKQRDSLFFPSLVSLPIEGEKFGDFTLSCKFAVDLCMLKCSRGNPSVGLDDGAGVDEVSRSGPVIWRL